MRLRIAKMAFHIVDSTTLGTFGHLTLKLASRASSDEQSDCTVQTKLEELSGTSTVPRTAHHIALFESHDRNMKYDSLSCF